MLRLVYKVEIEVCPTHLRWVPGGGSMTVLGFVTEQAVVRRILAHLERREVDARHQAVDGCRGGAGMTEGVAAAAVAVVGRLWGGISPREWACSCSPGGSWDKCARLRRVGKSHAVRRALRRLADGRNAALGVARRANLRGFVPWIGPPDNESSFYEAAPPVNLCDRSPHFDSPGSSCWLVISRSVPRGSSSFYSRSTRVTLRSPAHGEMRWMGAPSIRRFSTAVNELFALTHPDSTCGQIDPVRCVHIYRCP